MAQIRGNFYVTRSTDYFRYRTANVVAAETDTPTADVPIITSALPTFALPMDGYSTIIQL